MAERDYLAKEEAFAEALGARGRPRAARRVGAPLTGQQLEGAHAQAMESSQVSTMAREDLEKLVLEKPEVGLTR